MPISHPGIAGQPYPADLQAILNELDKTDEQARRLVSSLSQAQFDWQPGGVGWSVGQCLDHLARTNTVYTAALREGVQRTKPGSAARKGPIQPGWFGRWFINLMEPPPRRKMTAPRKATPGAHPVAADVLRTFVAAHDQARALIAESRELDLNKVRFTNPFISVIHFTVGTGLMIIGAHDRRHLWQANQVCEAMKQELPVG